MVRNYALITVFPRSVAAVISASRKCGAFSRAAFIRGRRLFCPPDFHRFPPRPQRSCELCPRPLALSPARAMADLELELAQFSYSSAAIRGHHVYLATHLRMRIATVHIRMRLLFRAATITLSSCSVRRLFEGGVYSGCGVYSRKYGICMRLLYTCTLITRMQNPCTKLRTSAA